MKFYLDDKYLEMYISRRYNSERIYRVSICER